MEVYQIKNLGNGKVYIAKFSDWVGRFEVVEFSPDHSEETK